MKRPKIQRALDLKHRGHFRDRYLLPALAVELVAMTVPDKPSSRRQQYRLTDAGLARRADLRRKRNL